MLVCLAWSDFSLPLENGLRRTCELGNTLTAEKNEKKIKLSM